MAVGMGHQLGQLAQTECLQVFRDHIQAVVVGADGQAQQQMGAMEETEETTELAAAAEEQLGRITRPALAATAAAAAFTSCTSPDESTDSQRRV